MVFPSRCSLFVQLVVFFACVAKAVDPFEFDPFFAHQGVLNEFAHIVDRQAGKIFKYINTENVAPADKT
jgi:hypothetical protein